VIAPWAAAFATTLTSVTIGSLVIIAGSAPSSAPPSESCSNCTTFSDIRPTIIDRFNFGTGTRIDSLVVGRDGIVWIGAIRVAIGSIQGRTLRKKSAPAYAGLMQPDIGRLWFAQTDGRVAATSVDGTTRELAAFPGDRACRIKDLALDIHGNPWIVETCRGKSVRGPDVGFVVAFDRISGRYTRFKQIPEAISDSGMPKPEDVTLESGSTILAGDGVETATYPFALRSPWISTPIGVIYEAANEKQYQFYGNAHLLRNAENLPMTSDGLGGVFLIANDHLCRITQAQYVGCDATDTGYALPVIGADGTLYSIDRDDGVVINFRFEPRRQELKP
jgi:hypothetical protein